MNIIVTGAPRSGTSIVAAMINKLGWNFAPDANWGGESHGVEQLNRELLSKGLKFDALDTEELKTANIGLHSICQLKKPFIIKSPIFAYTLGEDDARPFDIDIDSLPLLIVVCKHHKNLKESWKRLNGKKTYEKDGHYYTKDNDIQMNHWITQSLHLYEQYQGPKLLIQYEKLPDMVKLFDLGRAGIAMQGVANES